MEFAIAYPARPDAWQDLVVAEDHGFSHAWFMTPRCCTAMCMCAWPWLRKRLRP